MMSENTPVTLVHKVTIWNSKQIGLISLSVIGDEINVYETIVSGVLSVLVFLYEKIFTAP